MLCSQAQLFPKKMLQFILSGTHLTLSLFLMLTVIGLLDAGMELCWFFICSLISQSVICLRIQSEVSLFRRARSSLMYLLRLLVPTLRHWQQAKSGQPSETGMISKLLAPPEITKPEYLPVKQSGATQLRANSIFSILSFLNIILYMHSSILRSVNTFSKMMTVLPWHEQLMQEKNMLQSSYSICISNFQILLAKVRKQGPDLIILRGTLSPTNPTLMFSLPIYMMMSSFFELSIIAIQLQLNKIHIALLPYIHRLTGSALSS